MYDERLCCRVHCDGDAVISITADGDCSLGIDGDGEQGAYMQVGHYDRYGGPYEVTPTQETQTLDTAGLVMAEPVVVHPIPENYGLITWNGYSLRVS